MQGLLIAGRYRLVDSIGSGGMGRVWRAHDELLHRAVAIKELTAALYVAEADQPVLLARTRAEARAAARINHSAVVTVHDVLEHDGRPWIVMELVEGRSLADAVKADGRVEPTEAARIGMWVLRALRAAHSAGVLHRDVKPGNVLLSEDGRVLLTDFGIAQIEGDTTITRTGEVVGSVDYLAPERVRGNDPGPSSDLWALGATLYTAVEGRSPFRRTSPLSTMQAVVQEEAADPQHAGVLGPVITALLRKDPATRPGIAEAEQMLAEVAEGRRAHGAQAYVPTQYGGGGYGASGQGVESGAGFGSGSNGVYGVGGTSGVGGAAGGTVGGGSNGAGFGTVGGSNGSGGAGFAGGGDGFGSGGGVPSYGGGGEVHSAGGGVVQAPPKRRRLRTLALVVVLAALVGGGTAVAFQRWDEGRQSGGSSSAGASPSPSAVEGAVPDSWVEVNDPLGFGLSLPKGWNRQVFQDDGDLKQIDYTPDNGKHFLRIAMDISPDYADPHAHQIDLEKQLQRLVDYRRVKLEENLYRDRKGSEWEYTWTALAKDTKFPGSRRAVEETYVAHDGTEYAIYMSSPVEDWAAAAKQFTSVLKSWREADRSGG
ncbi:serine/threonine-protein kinase [Streptomyces acidiscabies]|uniref:non-specific serine/threonine protein kinase n=1 Tax=Streptomyces acidiscabies TaxID=42234 RepID=A0AAP6EIL5_9ACTN|nr:serine/threonine-protein kinase [Streptomyces acidiscabies]MBP5937478.1 serine/threonine protein kinase [Streptomyces sp. LBUM 1476]MBZ3914439.1 serine/threonine protein kinase [Streptomyces acidiscabies]MDX2964307.1 serine/threonine-protein kinase [Streptomyces acidiscabies]MDX3017128.1 serine/threonine-protein kinase [Streptomyces acidiscabies]MDX3789079.1 serine/threonine-protein kinase [Streptomyces acidiscabies]